MIKSKKNRQVHMVALIFKYCILIAAVIVISNLNIFADNTICYDADGNGSTKKEAVEVALRKVYWNCLSDFSQISPDTIKNLVKQNNIVSIVKKYIVNTSSDSTTYDSTAVSVHAEINMEEVIKLLEKRNEIESLTYYPRVLLNIKKNDTEFFNNNDAFTRMIEDKLISKKMLLYKSSVLDTLLSEHKTLSTADSSSLSYKSGADFIITGTIETGEPYTADVYGAKQKRVSCCANLQLIDCSEGRILSSLSLCDDWGSKSTTIACENCFLALLKNKKFTMIDSIESFWKKSKYCVFPVSIHLYDLKDEKIDEVECKIKKLPSVIQITSKILNKNENRLNILCRGSMPDIYNSILNIQDISISISGKGQIHIKDRDSIMNSENPVGTSSSTEKKYNSNQISVTGYTIPPLYPCAIEHYIEEPCGNITLRNNTQKKLEKIHLSSTINGLSIPSDTIIDYIAPEKSTTIPITASLDQREVQKIDHSTQTKISVKCTFKEKNDPFITDFDLPVIINGLNDFDWTKPEMIASFITPTDQAVKGLSRFALSSFNFKIDSIPQNVAQAAAIYECLRKTGIAYIKDITVKKNIDNIQFPFQTMTLGTGDCDDTSILLASLLESIGIETSLLVSENHVFIMFNSGVFSKNACLVSNDSTKYIDYKGMIWLPIETTDFNSKSFLEAWKKGIQQYHDSRYYSFVSIINTHQSWEKYPPANPVHQEIPVPKINANDLRAAIDEILNQFVRDRNEEYGKIEKKYSSLSGKNKGKAYYNRLGVFYAQNNMHEKSLKNFRNAFDLDTLDPDIIVNLANIYCLTEQYDSAEQLYSEAITLNPDDGVYYLNQYLFYIKSNNSEQCTESLRKFTEKAGLENIGSYLGLELKSIDNETSKGENVSDGKYTISIQLIKNSIKRLGKSIIGPGKKRRKPTILPVGDRVDMVDFRRLFFFKQLQE